VSTKSTLETVELETVETTRFRFDFGQVPYFVPALFIFIALLIANAVGSVGFLNNGGWQQALLSASPLMLMAMAIAPPVISGNGGVDLSVGPLTGLVGILIAGWFVPAGIDNVPLLWVLAIVIGAAAGAINGALVAFVRVTPIIATLATYLIFSGLGTYLMPIPGGIVAPGIKILTKQTGPIPNTLFVILAVGVLWMLLLRTSYWRNLVAVGSNDRAAFTAGISVRMTRFIAFVLAGAMSGIAGVVFCAVLGGGDATVGPNFTTLAMASVAVGGISLMGGRGGLVGAVLGGASLFLIQNILSFMQMSSFAIRISYGLCLIGAIVFNGGMDAIRYKLRRT
jgi:ribose transport system permease protein